MVTVFVGFISFTFFGGLTEAVGEDVGAGNGGLIIGATFGVTVLGTTGLGVGVGGVTFGVTGFGGTTFGTGFGAGVGVGAETTGVGVPPLWQCLSFHGTPHLSQFVLQ